MRKYKVSHLTQYDYSVPVTISQHLLHIVPRKTDSQIWKNHTVTISPKPEYTTSRIDIFGNNVTAFGIEEEHLQFKVLAEGEVTVNEIPNPNTSLCWEDIQDALKNPKDKEDIEASMFMFNSPLINFDESIKRYAEQSFTKSRPLIEAVKELNHRIFTDFKYTPNSTKIGTLPVEILRERKGVCQDFAHFMTACMRSMGLSCAYISGYINTRKTEEEHLIGADATHAWVSVYVKNYGFLDFDPTNDCIPTDEHIIVAKGRDFSDVSPLKGVITGGGQHSLKVEVNVKEISGV